MTIQNTRRDILKGGLAAAGPRRPRHTGLGAAGARAGRDARAVHRHSRERPLGDAARPADARHPDDRRPVHAQGQVLHDPALRPSRGRSGDVPAEGLGPGRRPKSLSLDELRKMGSTELVAGFECSGNRASAAGAVRQRTLDRRAAARRCSIAAGVKAAAREFVFFGADHGEEEVEFRTQKFKVDQQFGRSLSREKALSPEPFLAYALNGEPLTQAPGLAAAADRAGLVRRRQRQVARRRSTCRKSSTSASTRRAGTARCAGEMIDGEMKWMETADHPHAAEVVHRARHQGRQPAQGARRRAERRHADQVGRGEGRRRPVAAGDDGSGDERQVLRGSCSPTPGTAPRRASTRSSRA